MLFSTPKYFALTILLFSVSLCAQDGVYSIDKESSVIEFKIGHLGLLKVKGTFESYEGTVGFDQSELKEISCKFLVESIATGNEERDDILETEPYFDVQNYPDITYVLVDTKTIDGETILNGKLKIKDSEQDISFPASINFDESIDSVIIEAETRIDRRDYDLIFDSMNGLIGNKIDIKLSISSTK